MATPSNCIRVYQGNVQLSAGSKLSEPGEHIATIFIRDGKWRVLRLIVNDHGGREWSEWSMDSGFDKLDDAYESAINPR